MRIVLFAERRRCRVEEGRSGCSFNNDNNLEFLLEHPLIPRCEIPAIGNPVWKDPKCFGVLPSLRPPIVEQGGGVSVLPCLRTSEVR